jgi:hypothetical protein
MIDPLAGIAICAFDEAAVVSAARFGDAGAGVGVAAGGGEVVGSGLDALGGVGVRLPVPGFSVVIAAVLVAAVLLDADVCETGGISKYWPSRMVKSGSSPFHSERARTDTPYRREMVKAVSPRTTLWRIGSSPVGDEALEAAGVAGALSMAALASSVTLTSPAGRIGPEVIAPVAG